MSIRIQDQKIISLILVGDSTVGKTSLMRSFNEQKFIEKNLSNIGVDVYTKNININNEVCSIKIWDTCGQERFRSLASNYYKRADGVVLLYDISSIASFNNLEYWLKSIQSYCKRDIPIIIIGNKLDLGDKINEEIFNKFISEHSNIPIFKTSAKNGDGVNEAFYNIAQKIYDFKSEYQIIELSDKFDSNYSKSC